MDASLFNEQHADAIVRAVSILYGNKLIMLNTEGTMQFIKTDDGSVHQVIESAIVTKADLEDRVAKATAALDVARQEFEAFNKLNEEPSNASGEPIVNETPGSGEYGAGNFGGTTEQKAAEQTEAIPAPAETPQEAPVTSPDQGPAPQPSPQAGTPEPAASTQESTPLILQ